MCLFSKEKIRKDLGTLKRTFHRKIYSEIKKTSKELGRVGNIEKIKKILSNKRVSLDSFDNVIALLSKRNALTAFNVPGDNEQNLFFKSKKGFAFKEVDTWDFDSKFNLYATKVAKKVCEKKLSILQVSDFTNLESFNEIIDFFLMYFNKLSGSLEENFKKVFQVQGKTVPSELVDDSSSVESKEKEEDAGYLSAYNVKNHQMLAKTFITFIKEDLFLKYAKYYFENSEQAEEVYFSFERFVEDRINFTLFVEYLDAQFKKLVSIDRLKELQSQTYIQEIPKGDIFLESSPYYVFNELVIDYGLRQVKQVLNSNAKMMVEHFLNNHALLNYNFYYVYILDSFQVLGAKEESEEGLYWVRDLLYKYKSLFLDDFFLGMLKKYCEFYKIDIQEFKVDDKYFFRDLCEPSMDDLQTINACIKAKSVSYEFYLAFGLLNDWQIVNILTPTNKYFLFKDYAQNFHQLNEKLIASFYSVFTDEQKKFTWRDPQEIKELYEKYIHLYWAKFRRLLVNVRFPNSCLNSGDSFRLDPQLYLLKEELESVRSVVADVVTTKGPKLMFQSGKRKEREFTTPSDGKGAREKFQKALDFR